MGLQRDPKVFLIQPFHCTNKEKKVLEFLWDLPKIFILVKMIRYGRRPPAPFSDITILLMFYFFGISFLF